MLERKKVLKRQENSTTSGRLAGYFYERFRSLFLEVIDSFMGNII